MPPETMEPSINPDVVDPIDGLRRDLTEIFTSPIRASRHLAIWLVWHSIGVSLITEEEEA
jgi:hypothetical protein